MSSNLKILRVIGSMDPSQGGPCQGIRNSIPALEKIGAHNEVVTLDKPDASFIGMDSFKIHAIGPAKGPWGYSSNLIPWLLLNLERFDCVIVHGLWQYYSYATLKAVKKHHKLIASKKNGNSTKLFVMPHGMLDPYFQNAPDRKLKAARNWLYWKLIEGKVINQSDGILFTCEAELQLAKEPFRPYNPKAELNVGYGIAAPPAYEQNMADAFLEKCKGLSKDSSYLLFLGRIDAKKGVDLLIKTYAKAHHAGFPKLVIAGPGIESSFGQKLLTIIKENKHITNDVLFPGMLSGDSKWGAFYGCEAFILPSHQENFGIAVVEALACEKPVLISNQVNIWKEIEAEKGGLVADNSLEGTHKLIKTWMKLSVLEQKQMGLNGRYTFEKYYAIEKAAGNLLNTIKGKIE